MCAFVLAVNRISAKQYSYQPEKAYIYIIFDFLCMLPDSQSLLADHYGERVCAFNMQQNPGDKLTTSIW